MGAAAQREVRVIAMASRRFHLVQIGIGATPEVESQTELSYPARLSQTEIENGGVYDHYSTRFSPLSAGKVKHSGLYPLMTWPQGVHDGELVRQELDYIQMARSVWTPFLFYSDVYTPPQHKASLAAKCGQYLWAYGKVTSVSNPTSVSDYMSPKMAQVQLEGILRTPLMPVTWARWRYGLRTVPQAGVIGDNLIINGGFESVGASGSGGINLFSPAWVGTAPGTSSIAAVASPVHSGSTAAMLARLIGDVGNIPSIKQLVTVTAGSSYQLSFWPRGNGAISCAYKVRNETAGSDIVALTNTSIDTSYSQVTIQFIAPAGCATISVTFQPSSDWFCYVDDVSLYKMAAPATQLVTDELLLSKNLQETIEDMATDTPSLWYVPCELQQFCWNTERFWPRNLYADNLNTGSIEFDFTRWECPYKLLTSVAKDMLTVDGNTRPRTRCLMRGDTILTVRNALGTFTYSYGRLSTSEIYTDSWTGVVMERDINYNVSPVAGAGIPPQLHWDDNIISINTGYATVGAQEAWIN